MPVDHKSSSPFASLIASAAGLDAETAAERDDAVKSAKREAEQIVEIERARLRQECAELETDYQASLRTFDEAAEAKRRACADALVARANGPGGFPDLVAAWRVEPTRAKSAAILGLWLELKEAVKRELGDELTINPLFGAFVESVARTIPGAVAITLSYGLVSNALSEGVMMWNRAADPATAQRALELIESWMLETARSLAGSTVEPAHHERLAIRKSTLTGRDHAREQAAFEARERARIQSEHERNQVAREPGWFGRTTQWVGSSWGS